MKTIIFLVLLLSINAAAQVNFEIRDAPAPYDVAFDVGSCDGNYCTGDMNVWLRQKGQTAVFQHLKLSTDFDYLKAFETAPVAYDGQGAIYFGDYNFDGAADMAIQNGRDGAYGTSTYNIYIYSPRLKKFVFDKYFTKLSAGTFIGMFDADGEKRIISVFTKAGCGFREERKYKVIGGRPIMIYQKIEDESSSADWSTTTIKRRVNGKWRVKVIRDRKV